ncbi:MAG: chitinase [Firmicutes bacterium]|nr:chitinase [Bacillota bacterium]
MKAKKMKSLVFILLLGLILIGLIGCSTSAKKPLPFAKTKAKLQVMGFYEKGWNDLTYGFPSLKAHYKEINVLMPYWYTLNADGSIKTASVGLEPEVIDFIRQHPEIKLLPLINKDLTDQSVLTDATTRNTAISNIVKTVTDNKYDGVNIDFELLPAKNRDDLTVFIRDLAKQLHSQNKMVSVSVMPKLDGLEEIGAAYDYGALGKLTDFVTIMTYDKHAAATKPGSVSPYKWVEKNIKEALKSIPANKLVVCIGAYGYDWPVPEVGETKYIGMREAQQRADSHKAKVKWDDDSQSAYFFYWDGGVKHEVWFENGFSITRKVALAKKYNIRGVAIWRIGFEDKQYWSKLHKAVNK